MVRDNQVFKNDKGHTLGVYNFEDKAFRKKVKLSKHLFRMRNAWGIDAKVVDEIRAFECEQIRILEEESGRVYVISFDDFWKNSIIDIYGNEGRQYFCGREHFNVTDRNGGGE